MVDDKHQIIVVASAFGEATEYNLLSPMIEITRQNFSNAGLEKDIFQSAKLTADSGFHTNDNMKMLWKEQVDTGGSFLYAD